MEKLKLALKLIISQVTICGVVWVIFTYELFNISYQDIMVGVVGSALFGISFLHRVSIGAIIYYALGQAVMLSFMISIIENNTFFPSDTLSLLIFLTVILYYNYAAEDQLEFASELRKAESPTSAD